MNILLGFVSGMLITLPFIFFLQRKKSLLLFKEGESFLEKTKKEAQELKEQTLKDARFTIREQREQLEQEYKQKQQQLLEQEKQFLRKDVILGQREEKLNLEEKKYQQREQDQIKKQEQLEEEEKNITSLKEDFTIKLSHLAMMSKEQAKQELVNQIEQEAKLEASKKIKKIEEETQEESERLAKKIISVAIQRFASEYVAESTITSVELQGDEVKGRLIGREGRNIRAFEQICGVDLIIDDTPGVVVISSFNVLRREIARLTIEKLISDERIHPARIEEFHERSRQEIEHRIKQLGERAQMEIGVHGIHPEILRMIGALNYRTSYTQNQYQHSLEVAFLCGAMAAELKLNVKQARRAGLLHDIGKVMDLSQEASHAVVGADFAKKYGESPDIVHAIRAHHEDERPETVLAHLVIAADALSGARPGIRKAMMQSYVNRLVDIERIVASFPGVEKCYALSGGREVRVLVQNEKISDEQTLILSQEIAKKIEQEMSYPGTIKIAVVRETKAIGYAR